MCVRDSRRTMTGGWGAGGTSQYITSIAAAGRVAPLNYRNTFVATLSPLGNACCVNAWPDILGRSGRSLAGCGGFNPLVVIVIFPTLLAAAVLNSVFSISVSHFYFIFGAVRKRIPSVLFCLLCAMLVLCLVLCLSTRYDNTCVRSRYICLYVL